MTGVGRGEAACASFTVNTLCRRSVSKKTDGLPMVPTMESSPIPGTSNSNSPNQVHRTTTSSLPTNMASFFPGDHVANEDDLVDAAGRFRIAADVHTSSLPNGFIFEANEEEEEESEKGTTAVTFAADTKTGSSSGSGGDGHVANGHLASAAKTKTGSVSGGKSPVVNGHFILEDLSGEETDEYETYL